ncbi:MAG: type III pantothenate kinase [Steroidobacteraceae bacterium]
MSVLLVDIGNTRIKWAVWLNGRIGPMRAAAHAGWSRKDYERRVFGSRPARLSRIIVASVAGARVDRRLAAAARSATRVQPEFIATERRAAGVTTRYVDPWRLGVDRFVGAIGAHQLAGARAVCVVNAGTTLTIDLIDGKGVHRGGVILPGPQLMVHSLLESTAGIARRARDAAAGGAGQGRSRSRRAPDLFARSTKSAIGQGALYAVAALVDRAVAEARRALGTLPMVLLSGGGAEQLEPLIRSRHLKAADLVLRGIAVHAGLAVRAGLATR